VEHGQGRNSLGHSKDVQDHLADYNGNGETILIIDDDELQREIATSILLKAGYITHSVPSGEKAVDFLKVTKADLIVLDMIMTPGINGYETYRRISDFLPGQKAVIASGFVCSSDVEKAQALGAGRYVRKPYMVAELLSAVKAELEKE
jgi:CheY-like chemotaxis protein